MNMYNLLRYLRTRLWIWYKQILYGDYICKHLSNEFKIYFPLAKQFDSVPGQQGRFGNISNISRLKPFS